MPRETIETLPARLKELREKKGWSQQDLAQHADISLSTISMIERGERAPSFAMACSLADALGVSLESLRQPAQVETKKQGRGRPKIILKK